jgi:protein-tyrosine kinase
MTIIEAALEKQKAARGKAPGIGAGTVPHMPPPQARPRSGDTLPEALPPITQLEPVRVAFDSSAARDNRLMLNSSVIADRGIIAAYGMLRTRLLHRMRAKGWQSLGITSASPQDGKSLTAVNLALSLAREKNNNVVLIDLDMRNPSVCRTLGISPSVELLEYFEGRTQSLDGMFMSIGIENLIVAGNVTPIQHSAELLSSTRLEELLLFVKRSVPNPLIVIDLPPVVSPEDTLVVAPRIDSLLLVASEGVTSRTEVQKAAHLLEGFPLAGFVLNRCSDSPEAYAYGYGYGSKNTSK